MPLPIETIEARARSLKLLLFDVDGVLTDGSVHMQSDGTEMKTFYIRDGVAMVWAQRAGLALGLVSGRQSEATKRRAAELGVTIVIQGQNDKRAAYTQIVTGLQLRDDQVAFMGDDLLDLPVLTRVGLSAAPGDAAAEVLARVHWISHYAGGRGAAREFVEVVLRARGQWDGLVRSFSP